MILPLLACIAYIIFLITRERKVVAGKNLLDNVIRRMP
jgi:hypothetical protein